MSDECLPLVSEVRVIITTSMTDAQVQQMIHSADLMTRRCTTPLECELKAEIVKWTAAHLIANTSTATSGGTGIVSSESLGDASISFAKPVLGSTGLNSTTYGQQAIALDPNGCLASLGLRRTLVEVLGRDPNAEAPQ